MILQRWMMRMLFAVAWVPLWGGINVGEVGAAVDSDKYKRFLADWTARIEALKERKREPVPPVPPNPTPVPLPRLVKERGRRAGVMQLVGR